MRALSLGARVALAVPAAALILGGLGWISVRQGHAAFDPRPDGSACEFDSDCASGYCETRLGPPGGRTCSPRACGVCEGLDAAGACAPLANGESSARCGGNCDVGYSGPSDAKVCCEGACVCGGALVCERSR